MNRTILFRPDAGPSAGLGHLRRCLSLALALRSDGADCMFDIAEGQDIAAAAGFKIGNDTAPAAVVIDSYRTTQFNFASTVVAIDDVCDRAMPVDLVINPGIGAEALQYREAKSVALGIEYALLRPEFACEPNRVYETVARNLLVTMGGSDPHDLTPRLIESVAGKFHEVAVVIGPFFNNADAIKKAAATDPSVTLHRNPSDMRRLMMRADLALTGGGQTVVELAATATPAVVIEVAANQHPQLAGFASAAAIELAGRADRADIIERAAIALRSLANDRERRVRLGTAGRNLVDGRGAARAAERILAAIEN